MPARLDPAIVHAQIAGLRIRYPEVWNEQDEQLLNDMLEGSTNFNEILASLVTRALEAKAHANGIEELRNVLMQRQERFEQRNEAMRSIVLRLMTEAGVKKTELAAATLSVQPGKAKVVITDESKLPDRLFRITREPNKTAIKEHLESGTVRLEGAELSNSEPFLKISTR